MVFEWGEGGLNDSFKICMQKRKLLESFQFLSFGIFGRFKTRFYLRMFAQILV